MVGREGGVVCRGGGGVVGGLGGGMVGGDIVIVGGALIGHLSHVSVDIISVVVDMLDSAVRKVDRVGSLPSSCAIVRL